MEIQFKDSFFKSLKKVIEYERWYWKTWDFIRYELPGFFRNIWLFRKALLNYKWYGGHFSVFNFMIPVITDIANKMEKRGLEERISRNKKIVKMRRAVEIMSIFNEESFIGMAEEELGPIIFDGFVFEEIPDSSAVRIVENKTPEEIAHNKKVYDRAREIEKDLWKELWMILEGQDYSKFEEAPRDIDSNKSYDHWQNQFDGSGIRTWWD